jgi:hypothetical protein
MITKKIFLASSSELKEDREQFELFISRRNKQWIDKDVFLEVVLWEDFIDAVSKTRLQDEYNKAVQECDIFLMLFCTKVGQYTKEEFETAFGKFKTNDKPLIYTYFKQTPISTGRAKREDLQSLWDFQDNLKTLGHFYTVYENIDELKFKFDQQLNKLFDEQPNKLAATSATDLSHETILSWIARRRAGSDQYRSIAKSALHAHYGKHTEQGNNYVDFVVEKIIDRSAESAGITRENYISNIIVRGIPGEDLLSWEDIRSYTLVCPSMQGTHPLNLDLFFRADPKSLQSLISRTNQQISIDHTVVFDLRNWFDEVVGNKVPASGKLLEGKGGSLLFDGSWVSFKYIANIPLIKVRTDVEIVERSYLQQDERSYTLRVSQPVRQFNFSMTLGDNLEGWCLRQPTMSAMEYDPTARSQRIGERRVNASTSGWVLPGVVLTVEWTPPPRTQAAVTT